MLLSKQDVEILYLIKNNKCRDINDFDTFSHLEKLGFIAFTGAEIAYVTPLGEEALEKYEITHKITECVESSANAAKYSKKSAIFTFLVSLAMLVVAIIELFN